MAGQKALDAAAAMGRRRGLLFKDTGVPTPNPFTSDATADLGQAWRRAYISAVGASLPAVRETPVGEPSK